ncbi:MAG: hypothetical protein V5A45_14955 [Haloarculaceae archaeon]
MPQNTGTRLVQYARQQVDDALRTVLVLYDNDYEILYLRDDLKGSYSPEEYESVAESFRIEMNAEASDWEDAPIGEKATVIHYHDSAYVFQFPHEDCHSILLSVEPRVGSRLKSFIDGCREQI